MAHSVRKSLAGALYGLALADGTLSLTDSLATLGIDDLGGLTAGEKAATFGDLIASRSGVYLPSAYADSSQDKGRPARGSHAPGTFWFYNNWDFNTAETIYERKTGEDLYAAFDRRIARVIGMEDFSPAGQLEVLEPGRSQYPAHTMRISARDLARFGQLYLQDGHWGDRQVVPVEWVRESFKVRSVTGTGMGYGYLWWIYEPGALGASYPVLDRMPVYLARGTGGQTLFVLPQADMVIVHRADTDNGRSVPGPAIWQLVERLVGARTGQPRAMPRLTTVSPVPLASNLPAPSSAPVIALDAAARRRVAGHYEMAPGVVARVFEHEGRLFVSMPGQGEAELFATSPLTFIVKVQAGISVAFESDATGAAIAVNVTMGPQTMVGRRLPRVRRR
jgi:CubicO group peptidase (beta-lactamase class C family)